MAQAALPLMLAASVVQGVGTLAKGAGQASAYQANSRFDTQQAETALQQSYIKAAQTENQAARTGGRATAGYGAGGVLPGSGSALYVMNDIAKQGEMARQLQLYQGKVEQHSFEQQADVEHAQANAARTGSYIGAAGTLLGGLSSAAGSQFWGGGGGGDSGPSMGGK